MFLYFNSLFTLESLHKIQRTEDGFILSIDVPGFNKDNIKVKITGRNLSVYGKNDGRELSFSYLLDSKVSSEKVKAEVKDGVLRISIVTDKEKTSEIEVK